MSGSTAQTTSPAQVADQADPAATTAATTADPGNDQGVSAQDTAGEALASAITPPDPAAPAPAPEPQPEPATEPLPVVRPSVGRIVHYVLGDGDGRNHGQCRPAIVVRDPWGEDATPRLNLAVVADGSNDELNDGRSQIANAPVVWRTSVEYDAGRKGGSWHWFGNQAGSTHA